MIKTISVGYYDNEPSVQKTAVFEVNGVALEPFERQETTEGKETFVMFKYHLAQAENNDDESGNLKGVFFIKPAIEPDAKTTSQPDDAK